MKIYLLGEDDYDGTNIYGLYSSREKSIEAYKAINKIVLRQRWKHI